MNEPTPSRRLPAHLKLVGFLLMGLGALSIVGMSTYEDAAPSDATVAVLLVVLGFGLVRARRWAWWLGALLSATGLLLSIWLIATEDPTEPAVRAALLAGGVPSLLFAAYLAAPFTRRPLGGPWIEP